MRKQFFELIHAKGNLGKCTLLMIAVCFFYAVFYQFVSSLLYRIDNSIFFYLIVYIIALFLSFVAMVLTHYYVDVKRQVEEKSKLHRIAPLLMSQSIYILLLLALGAFSFSNALKQDNSIVAYGVNAFLLLGLLFYLPLSVFSFLQIKDGIKNPIRIIQGSFQKIGKHYRGVFYSCLLLLIFFIGYRYLMEVLFSFQMNLALYDMPLELLLRSIPFLDTISLLSSISGNLSLIIATIFSFLCSLLLCFLSVLFLFYSICIQDEDISV